MRMIRRLRVARLKRRIERLECEREQLLREREDILHYGIWMGTER